MRQLPEFCSSHSYELRNVNPSKCFDEGDTLVHVRNGELWGHQENLSIDPLSDGRVITTV